MHRERQTTKHHEDISEEDAHRLLARAVELDAQHRAAVPVADLEHAAYEAGIAPEAFALALAELRAGLLQPETVGQKLVAKLVALRRPACLTAFMAAAMVTPGDAVLLTLLSGSAAYAGYEGLIALTRLLGNPSSPQGPHTLQKFERPEGTPQRKERLKRGHGTQFVVVTRPALLGSHPAL